ncbi:aspartate/glutamate racemase family protein [Paraburkholderia sp.]|uniref:aspartate/glutamate racemase family protein n=1 Tax=Paraburkholderia sp. TaxID=1926495 RepID=UPI003D70113B
MPATPARIACLHTAHSNISLFERAAAAAGRPLALRHEVRADLLERAEHAGAMTPDLAAETELALRALAGDADAVLLNCSTLGPAADAFAASSTVPVLRADAALAQRAVAQGEGGTVVVLCTVQTTLVPTTRTFADAVAASAWPDTSVDVRLIDGAWARFKAGDLPGYLASIAEAADQAYDSGAHIVAFAQASMADAATRLHNGRGRIALDSPTAAIEALVAALAVR